MIAWAFVAGLVACGARPPSDMIPIAGSSWIDPYEFPNQKGVKPETETNLAHAADACATVGKRLCTAAEWRRAC